MIYDKYALVYDLSGQVRFSILMAQYLKEVLQRHPVNGQQVLDLACGTGTLALALASQGWHVTGLDASEAMLKQARAKLPAAEAEGQAGSVTFIQGDMRHTEHGVPAKTRHLVTCIFDSMNYLLTEADLRTCFAAVEQVLVAGGLFFFDMNTRYFLEHDWAAAEVQEQPGYIQVGQSRFDSQQALSTMRLTGFVGDDNHGYARFDETHIERAYPQEVVAALVEEVGLQLDAIYDCFTFQPPYPTSQRLAWVVRKPPAAN